jgi:hypothetical protein
LLIGHRWLVPFDIHYSNRIEDRPPISAQTLGITEIQPSAVFVVLPNDSAH